MPCAQLNGIHDLRLASKADTGVLPLAATPQSIAAILDELHALHQPLAHAKGVRLVVAIDGELPRATVDRHRVLQMPSNLVANAIKFTPQGGHVELRTRAEPEHVVFTVSDTGAGIAPEELPHVFDRFWHGANARHLGAGLGLSISRSIATAHGGDVTVESRPGEGATFTVVLPRTPAPGTDGPTRPR